MGLPVVVDVRDAVDRTAVDDVFDWLREVDARFSPYRADSDVSRLGRGELPLHETHPDVQEVYARCEELRVETDGYFDVAVVGGDPSGYVKGWAVDRAAAILEDAGARIGPDRSGRWPTVIAAECRTSDELCDYIVEAEAKEASR